ncbi:hypothetical protein BaRGS_00021680 [Batillaria attramentaria]|uniref:Uncharacterized protein n=1 Tax=Batillaria attramentaria TaxID=370345 RepID=A0ABD0KIZ3_9CAEN
MFPPVVRFLSAFCSITSPLYVLRNQRPLLDCMRIVLHAAPQSPDVRESGRRTRQRRPHPPDHDHDHDRDRFLAEKRVEEWVMESGEKGGEESGRNGSRGWEDRHRRIERKKISSEVTLTARVGITVWRSDSH